METGIVKMYNSDIGDGIITDKNGQDLLFCSAAFSLGKFKLNREPKKGDQVLIERKIELPLNLGFSVVSWSFKPDG
ncbi:MAG: hypothetical protein AAB693_00045 [Patescibacteria group bacterium]